MDCTYISKEQRDYYQLEDFWADAEITNVEEN